MKALLLLALLVAFAYPGSSIIYPYTCRSYAAGFVAWGPSGKQSPSLYFDIQREKVYCIKWIENQNGEAVIYSEWRKVKK